MRLSHFYGEGEGDSAQTIDLSPAANDLPSTPPTISPKGTPVHKHLHAFHPDLTTIQEVGCDRELPEIVIERIDSEKTENTLLSDEEGEGEDPGLDEVDKGSRSPSINVQPDPDGGYSNPDLVKDEDCLPAAKPTADPSDVKDRRAMLVKAATFPAVDETSSEEDDEAEENLTREEIKERLMRPMLLKQSNVTPSASATQTPENLSSNTTPESARRSSEPTEGLLSSSNKDKVVTPSSETEGSAYGMFHPTSFESSSEDEEIVDEVQGRKKINKERSPTVGSDGSLTFDAQKKNALDATGGPLSGPQAFKTYLKDIRQKSIDAPNTCNGNSPQPLNGSVTPQVGDNTDVRYFQRCLPLENLGEIPLS